MASDSIPFFTGKILSIQDPLDIPAGTAVSAFTAEQQNAKHRVWELDGTANPANLPYNPYRANVIVDNSQSTEDARIVQNGILLRTIPASTREEEGTILAQVGCEAFSVVMAGTTVPVCIVTERSFT